ncbi:MAG: glycosyltransferase, partial [Nitrospiraceae bacterium]|nr:glycosyltransferase [Nitrospiraceae bacterium]
MSKNKKIHILQVVHSLIIGGTERVVCDLTRAFNNDEFRTSVCCIDGLGEFGQDLLSEGFSVDVFARRPGVDTSLIYQLRKIYKKYEIDIIHAHQYTPYFYAASAAFFSGRRPVIFTEHGRHYPDFVRPKRAVINQALRLTTAAYTGVSEFTRQSLVSFEKMPSHRMQVIYNGIWSNGDCTIADRNALRESLGIGASNRLVLSVGRMDPVKDFETLIRAFARVAHEIPGALLWIAGG